MMTDPEVVGPASKYAGKRYKLGLRPSRRFADHNHRSWTIIETILQFDSDRDFWDLAVAVRGHKHYGDTKQDKGPQSFVRYCIRAGWLEEV